ncbi:hypothetical protein [Rhodoferax sp.]|uniref:hypothetical protein n=1 Tax=Rhodoferax sp. TaxID=50421 RepID=UPI00261F20D5|nr:hypothetical protein [Rhodoferax sp.]MDD2811233.1 hypothetical protein [Rhodoferax sp.]
MKPNISRKTLAVGALLMSATLVQAATNLPPVHRSGNIEYMTGGVGVDESTAIQSASRKWPLTLEFAIKDKERADFAADVNVVVSDAKNHSALHVKSGGPFVLARVKPGKYMVAATLAGKTLQKQVVVTSGAPTKVEFLWPTGTGETHL